MMDLTEIRDINRRMTRDASKHKREPWVPTEEQRAKLANGIFDVGQKIQFFADYNPKGWTRHDELLFVDMSGIGLDSEPALTQAALARVIAADPIGTGYALVELGQFQGYIARYSHDA